MPWLCSHIYTMRLIVDAAVHGVLQVEEVCSTLLAISSASIGDGFLLRERWRK
jgi:hypothetical protein